MKAWVLALLIACFPVAYWASGMDQTKEEVHEQRQAIVKIGERLEVHITKRRYQDCFNRCIPPEECPQDTEPLPRSRCEPGR